MVPITKAGIVSGENKIKVKKNAPIKPPAAIPTDTTPMIIIKQIMSIIIHPILVPVICDFLSFVAFEAYQV